MLNPRARPLPLPVSSTSSLLSLCCFDVVLICDMCRNREQAEEGAYARRQDAAKLAKLREQLAKTEEEKVSLFSQVSPSSVRILTPLSVQARLHEEVKELEAKQ